MTLYNKDKLAAIISPLVIISTLMIAAYFVVRSIDSDAFSKSHTQIEVIAGIIGLVIGSLAYIRYKADKQPVFLLIGLGFICASLFDIYSAEIISSLIGGASVTPQATLAPWVLFASKTILSLSLFFSWLVWYLNETNEGGFTIAETKVYLIYLFTTVFVFIFFTYTPLPEETVGGGFFTRPYELIPGFVLLAALVGNIKRGDWTNDEFQYWLVLALFIGLVSQLLYMSSENILFSSSFMMFKVFKVWSYLFVLIGMLMSISKLYEKNNLNAIKLEAVTAEMEKVGSGLKERGKLKTDYISNMSHEFRTPMNSIIGFTNRVLTVGNENLSDTQKTYLKIVKKNANSLLVLINDIMNISKIEAGKMELYKEKFELNNLITEVVVMHRPLLGDKSLHIESTLHVDDLYLETDRNKLRNVLLNLISNAIKFTESGLITVAVSVVEVNRVLITVSDTGKGVSEDDIPMLFTEFWQKKTLIQSALGGTGLGLAICKNFTELMSGTLRVESVIDHGSDFIIDLPITCEDRYSVDEIEIDIDEIVGEGPLILCVDDNVESLLLIRETLIDAGFSVALASEGDDAIEKARKLSPVAITQDVIMKKRDGWDILRELKESWDVCDIPVIMVSALDNEEWGLKSGASAYLTKPLNKVDLVNELKKILKVKGALYVGDYSFFVDSIESGFEEEGIGLERVNSIHDAVDLLELNNYCAVLLSEGLDVFDSDKFAETCAEKSIPIISIKNNDERSSYQDITSVEIDIRHLQDNEATIKLRESVENIIKVVT